MFECQWKLLLNYIRRDHCGLFQGLSLRGLDFSKGFCNISNIGGNWMSLIDLTVPSRESRFMGPLKRRT